MGPLIGIVQRPLGLARVDHAPELSGADLPAEDLPGDLCRVTGPELGIERLAVHIV
ncbi:hypothetical protein [Arthrobacter woluwensis]|uniref:hypothetical protein n=1 Tax=Arthrobacter woluwensis TaxID=156980 RepID=UPI003801517A